MSPGRRDHENSAGWEIPEGSAPVAGASAGEDAELVALAEGTLEGSRARALRARLAEDPVLLARFGRLRADRLAATPATPPGPAAGDRVEPVGRPGDDASAARAAAATAPARCSRVMPAAVLAATAVLVAGALALAAAINPAPTSEGRGAVLDVTPVTALRSADLAGLWPGLGGEPADLGFLSEQDRLARCSAFAAPQVLGARPVVVDGRYGVAVASVAADDPGAVTIAVYGRDCSPLTGDTIAQVRLPR